MLRWLEKTVDDKKKTGDTELVQMLSAAYESVLLPRPSHPSLNLGRQVPSPTRTLTRSGSIPDIKELERWVKKLTTVLGARGRGFIVNLVLFDYRTAHGGRIRRATDQLRMGDYEAEEYTRPFESDLPVQVNRLLQAAPIPANPPAASSRSIRFAPLMDTPYVPPTRFTASFPVVLGKDQILDTPKLPGQISSGTAPVRYRFLASFGFAEPSYCFWDMNARTEYPGTRLSLGAYSLNTAYLKHLGSMLGSMGRETRQVYGNYGGVGTKHVRALLTLFGAQPQSGWNRGSQLAVGWVVQLLKLTRALVDGASRVAPSALGAFFQHVRRKIDVHETDLDFIWETRGAYPAQDRRNQRNLHFDARNVFDRIWVIESRLWELAFLGATWLSLQDMTRVLKQQLRRWTPSVGGDEAGVNEGVALGDDEILFERVLFPSGTAAADHVHERLRERGYVPLPVRVDRRDLSTFTPYFEFYQQSTSFLSPEGIAERESSQKKRTGGQLWLNLSDGLHEDLLGCPGKEVGIRIARMTSEFLRSVLQRIRNAPSRFFVVIDYTKLAADLPNNRLYPILATVAEWLPALLDDPTAVSGVLLLRSNLKYNTGSLDRYQLGEVLVWKGNAVNVRDDLIGSAPSSFAANHLNSDWTLRGEYLRLAKRVYLLYDAVSCGRWESYASLWESRVETAPRIAPSKLPVEIIALQSWILHFVEWPLAPIFTHLIPDTRRNALKAWLSSMTREKISSYWGRLTRDAEHLARSRSRFDPDIEARVNTVLEYLEPKLDEIIQELAEALGKIPRHDGAARKSLGEYMSRLKAALSKLRDQRPGAPSLSTSSDAPSGTNPKLALLRQRAKPAQRVGGRRRRPVRKR